MDIPNSYNTNNLGLIKSAEKHGAKCFVGQCTLSDIYSLDFIEYGYLDTIVLDALEQFPNSKTVTQTKEKLEYPVCEKLINIWTIQQDILKGNDLNDFIILHYKIINNQPKFDIHPGRTRLFFRETYKKPLNVIILDYNGFNTIQGFTPFTEENCNQYKDQEFRLTDNWGMPFDNSLKYLLVQPNRNVEWHWHHLKQDVVFRIEQNDFTVSKITANNKPLIEFNDKSWFIPL